MKADKEIRILVHLLEVKTELQEKALKSPAKTRNFCMAEIKDIDKAIEIVRKEFEDEEKTDKLSGSWMPVKWALPNQDGMYLVTFDDGFVTATEHYNGEWQLWADSGEVIAWRGVPMAYKEGGK